MLRISTHKLVSTCQRDHPVGLTRLAVMAILVAIILPTASAKSRAACPAKGTVTLTISVTRPSASLWEGQISSTVKSVDDGWGSFQAVNAVEQAYVAGSAVNGDKASAEDSEQDDNDLDEFAGSGDEDVGYQAAYLDDTVQYEEITTALAEPAARPTNRYVTVTVTKDVYVTVEAPLNNFAANDQPEAPADPDYARDSHFPQNNGNLASDKSIEVYETRRPSKVLDADRALPNNKAYLPQTNQSPSTIQTNDNTVVQNDAVPTPPDVGSLELASAAASGHAPAPFTTMGTHILLVP